MIDEDRIAIHLSQFWVVPMEYDDSDARNSLYVAAVSFDVDISPEVNRYKIVYFIDMIKSEESNIRLILFPEVTV